jgi:hypothetical protein
VVAHLIRALLAAAVAGVVPGYFWVAVLRPASGLAERLTYSAVLSLASVPVIAVLLARIAGTGVTLWVALASVGIVFGTGVLAFLVKGAAAGPAATSAAAPVLPPATAVRDPRVLTLIAGVFALALATMLHLPAPGWLLLVIAAGLILAGALAAGSAPATEPAPASESATTGSTPATGLAGATGPVDATGPAHAAGRHGTASPADATGPTHAAGRSGEERPARPGVRAAALAAVLGLTAYRAYSGVISHDWPFVRGGDQFSHAVMAEQMLAHGSYGSYLIYPPGFPALTAVICRISGLTPLALFPVLAPALLVLCVLGAYTLATGLWGWPYGVAAAALNGLVLDGAYAGFAEGRYPDLIAAFFLLVMVVAALVTWYQSPTWRSGTLVTVVAGSVVLYHSVATLYLLLLLALVAVTALPYLLYQRQRRQAGALALTLCAVAVLSACYAALTYSLAGLVTGHSSTSTAVSLTIGSQPAPAARHLLAELAPALVWLGVFGVAALAAGIRRLARPPQVLAALTVLLWCALMYAGSRTAMDGFPQRFERDLGAPLSVTGAFGLVLVARSLLARRPATRPVLAASAATAAIVVAAVALVQATRGLAASAQPMREVLTHRVAAAGQWLAAHNTGGTIISTPYMNPGITNRAVLAMGGYTGLQSYGAFRIAHPRSLPTAGRKPLLDSQQVLLHPGSCQSGGILVQDDVRYVVLYRFGQGADLPAFAADPSRYHLVFQNPSVIIYAAAHAPCPAG